MCSKEKLKKNISYNLFSFANVMCVYLAKFHPQVLVGF